jgi:uncharacterized membrane protein YhaH (DUF805 family)
MDFVEAIKSGFRNYVTFKGRAPRSEYWYWTLFVVLVTLAGAIVDNALLNSDSGLFGPLISLALFLPGLAVSVRRLHDLDRSGWWLLLVLTIVGVIVLLIWACLKGTTGPNRFGADPLGGAEVRVAKKFDSVAKRVSFALIVLFALAPLISLIIGLVIAAGLGCELDEGSVHPCLFMGTDLGDTLYVMTVAMWFSMFTVPLGAVAVVVWLIVVAAHGRRQA